MTGDGDLVLDGASFRYVVFVATVLDTGGCA